MRKIGIFGAECELGCDQVPVPHERVFPWPLRWHTEVCWTKHFALDQIQLAENAAEDGHCESRRAFMYTDMRLQAANLKHPSDGWDCVFPSPLLALTHGREIDTSSSCHFKMPSACSKVHCIAQAFATTADNGILVVH
jgi:hypothetical protein